MDGHARQSHEHRQIEGEIERQGDPADARGRMRQPQPVQGGHPEAEAGQGRARRTAAGRAVRSARINSTQGTGATHASGHQSTGGNAAQRQNRTQEGHYPRRTKSTRRDDRTNARCEDDQRRLHRLALWYFFVPFVSFVDNLILLVLRNRSKMIVPQSVKKLSGWNWTP